jgi:hypothetical protein
MRRFQAGLPVQQRTRADARADLVGRMGRAKVLPVAAWQESNQESKQTN